MKQQFSSSKEQQQASAEHQQQKQQEATVGREFASVEEMLRHDAAQVHPPETIATRLKDSLSREPASPAPWWRRFWPW